MTRDRDLHNFVFSVNSVSECFSVGARIGNGKRRSPWHEATGSSLGRDLRGDLDLARLGLLLLGQVHDQDTVFVLGSNLVFVDDSRQ